MTLADFAIRVLRKLRSLEAGETASSEDTELVLAIYESVRQQLYSEGIINWSSTAAVPDWAVLPMVYMVAFHAADEFHVEPAMRMELQGMFDPAKGQLIKLTAPSYQSQPTESLDY